jgi:lactose/L-arabinose transport system ATP-binding protein
MSSVVLERVGKTYGAHRVIEDFDLQIEEGSFTVLVGPSGCGKSTLLRMIAGLEEITDGQLWIDGKVVNDADPIERGVAMVFQNYALYPHMTVEQNIGFSLRMAGLGRNAITRRVAEAASALQIEDLLKRKPAQLSGGQRQRVAIGRAIVRDPKVFLFDEPLSNLDAELRVSMRVEIAKLHRRLGSTMIYVTHDQTEAMTLADKIVVLRSGGIEQAGSPGDLYERPVNRFVAGFIGSPRMNFLSARARSGRLELAGDEGSVPFDGPDRDLVLGVRPEHFRIGDPNPRLSIKVDVVEYLGGTLYLYGTSADGAFLVVEARDQPHIRPGDSVPLGFAPRHQHLFDIDGRRVAGAHEI